MPKNHEERAREIHSVVDDIFIEASNGKISWEDAHIQMCNELFEEDNIIHEEILKSYYEELKSHVGHKMSCVHYADYQNIAVECEDCNTVLLDYDRPGGESNEELQDKKDDSIK